MHETTLIKISLCTFFVGVILLFAFLKTAKPDERSISSLTESDIDKTITLQGEVIVTKQFKEHLFLTFAQQCTLNASLFQAGNFKVNRGDKVIIVGKIIKKANSYEIIADEVRIAETKK